MQVSSSVMQAPNGEEYEMQDAVSEQQQHGLQSASQFQLAAPSDPCQPPAVCTCCGWEPSQQVVSGSQATDTDPHLEETRAFTHRDQVAIQGDQHNLAGHHLSAQEVPVRPEQQHQHSEVSRVAGSVQAGRHGPAAADACHQDSSVTAHGTDWTCDSIAPTEVAATYPDTEINTAANAPDMADGSSLPDMPDTAVTASANLPDMADQSRPLDMQYSQLSLNAAYDCKSLALASADKQQHPAELGTQAEAASVDSQQDPAELNPEAEAAITERHVASAEQQQQQQPADGVIDIVPTAPCSEPRHKASLPYLAMTDCNLQVAAANHELHLGMAADQMPDRMPDEIAANPAKHMLASLPDTAGDCAIIPDSEDPECPSGQQQLLLLETADREDEEPGLLVNQPDNQHESESGGQQGRDEAESCSDGADPNQPSVHSPVDRGADSSGQNDPQGK